MLTTRTLAVVGSAMALIVLGGCGGGSKKLSKSDLAKQAGAICAKATHDLDAIPKPSNIADANQAATYFSKAVSVADATMTKLRKLKPSDDVKSAWNKYVDLQQQEVDAFHNLRDKAKKKDASGLKDIQKLPALDSKVNAAARAAGITGCATSSG
jgi:hypothetical protein